MENLSIYIHYPFCKSKCPYCDFNSHVSSVDLAYQKRFTAAYLKEIEFFYNKIGPRKVKTIFFGDGTPSLMPIFMVEEILQKIFSLFEIAENIEISLEANPTSVEAKNFAALRKIGVNRLSLGIQALNNTDLKFLGREHSAGEALQAIELAKENFSNYSFDLIYARENQTLAAWQKELHQALKIGSPHLSLYQLTIEKGTKFFTLFRKGKFSLPQSDAKDILYDATADIAKEYDLDIYEVSNYAKKGFESKHNINYWISGDYIGIGAGAHSRFSNKSKRISLMNQHLPDKWLEQVEKDSNAVQKEEVIKKEELLKEITMMGLRSIYGIDEKVFLRFFNKNIQEIFAIEKLNNLIEEGLLQENKNKIIPSKQGIKLVNSIYHYLLC